MSKKQALWLEGQRHTQQKRWAQAAAAYQSIVEHDSGFVPAWLELSLAKEKLDCYRDAHRATLHAARVTQDVPPMAGLAVARRLRKFEEIAALHRYIDDTQLHMRLPPEKVVDLAMFLSSSGDHERALRWIEQVLKYRPQLPEAHNMLGLLRMFAGDMTAAAAAFERAIAIKPTYAAVYSVLSKVAPVSPDSNHVDTLRKLLSAPGLAPRDSVHLGYALHNELHELRDYEGAWAALSTACSAKQTIQPYDIASDQRLFSAIRESFARCDPPAESISDSLTPVFIVGMYRSGTTLLERILSGHPQVADAGETYTFSAQLREASDHFCSTTADEKLVADPDRHDYAAMGKGFLDAMRWRARGRPVVTEKLNANFILSGFIGRALPQAKLLHMQRDPADTCFSNLRTLFTAEAGYSYDPVQVADYYKAYTELMGHWREVMADRIFDVNYEALVADPAGTASRIAEHCGLEFDRTMLDVERESGTVATASFNVARKGIVSNRGSAWKPYERHLGPMLDRLSAHNLI